MRGQQKSKCDRSESRWRQSFGCASIREIFQKKKNSLIRGISVICDICDLYFKKGGGGGGVVRGSRRAKVRGRRLR